MPHRLSNAQRGKSTLSTKVSSEAAHLLRVIIILPRVSIPKLSGGENNARIGKEKGYKP